LQDVRTLPPNGVHFNRGDGKPEATRVTGGSGRIAAPAALQGTMPESRPVDLAMVLAVDGSASVTYDEFGLIAGGMAAALRDPTVVAGLVGNSMLSLLLWSGAGQQDILTGWTRIGTDGDLRAFADDVENMPRTVRAGATAIGEALLASLTLLAQVPTAARRNVVNVIGDGRSNDGVAPGPIRDRMAAADITINGLCILHEEPDLLVSYTQEVIGGPGAFAITCREYQDFAEAMRRKLTREIASRGV
jgi:Ca-activated chloride channel homolog